MDRLFLGVDVSKGYADFFFADATGVRLPGSQRYDDTPAGHAAVRTRCQHWLAQYPDAELLIGVEASGGLERNWLRGFREGLPTQRVRIYQLNPLAVKRFLERDLHRNITDPLSARGIAEYLREGLRSADRVFEPHLEGPLALYRFTCNTVDRGSQLENELQSLLPCVHPDLVSYCRDGLPAWVLQLLVRYPTAESLRRARPAPLARIPYLTPERAADLIQAAKRSVASVRDAHSAAVVTALAKEILRVQHQVASLKQRLITELRADPEVQLASSVTGIGLWTAVALRLEYGSFTRFHSAAAAVAFAGLDPGRRQSGDQDKPAHISRRGRKEIRAALYMATLTAIRCNPPIRAFYLRLKNEGKEHMVAFTACMGKLLRIAYACVLSEKPFDPARYAEIQVRHQAQAERQAEREAAARPETEASATPAAAPVVGALTAPVSRREAQRRKTTPRPPEPAEDRAATAPQAGRPRRKRGPGAALRRA